VAAQQIAAQETKATPPSILAATPPAGPPGTTFVLLPPCRLTNAAAETTSTPPAGVRHIDIKATRCGRIVPDFAAAYVLRKVTLDKNLPGNARARGAVGADHYGTRPK
jgi:hypothetical protein